MITVWLIGVGLAEGSFVNALVWRLHEPKLSIWKGRSMCPHCRHVLAPKDLVPVLSWLWLKGRCRYCHKPISSQYPLVEVITAALVAISYLAWPVELMGVEWLRFGVWLALVAGFVALAVYDLRWMLLPHKLVYPLVALAVGQWLILWGIDGLTSSQLAGIGLGTLIGGGFFYLLFQLSRGQWIGGGDVKLGFLLGIVVADGLLAWLMLFLAALLGSLVTIPLMLSGKANRRSRIPFGPFLLAATVIVVLFGDRLVDLADRLLLL
jgi:prepilin signal peptidase PulO-like enzyme (type II secretory pathway)